MSPILQNEHDVLPPEKKKVNIWCKVTITSMWHLFEQRCHHMSTPSMEEILTSATVLKGTFKTNLFNVFQIKISKSKYTK